MFFSPCLAGIAFLPSAPPSILASLHVHGRLRIRHVGTNKAIRTTTKILVKSLLQAPRCLPRRVKMGSLLVVVEASFGDVGYVGLPTACVEVVVEVALLVCQMPLYEQ